MVCKVVSCSVNYFEGNERWPVVGEDEQDGEKTRYQVKPLPFRQLLCLPDRQIIVVLLVVLSIFNWF